MKGMFFHRDEEHDVGEFMNSLGDSHNEVARDLVIIAAFGTETLECEQMAGGIWKYERLVGAGRRVVFLFDFIEALDVFIILHAFRCGLERVTRSDLNVARRRRRVYP